MDIDVKLAAALRAAGEPELTAMANKGLYKRALKDAEGAELTAETRDGVHTVLTGGERCVIGVPLSQSECSCPSRSVCRHILTAILLLKRSLPEEETPALPAEETGHVTEPPTEEESKNTDTNDEPKTLSASEKAKVHSCVEMCAVLLCGIITHGLVRAPESAAEDFELAAVRCHAAKMAECERHMRWLSGRLADNTARRASFDIRVFTDRLIETACLLESLSREDIRPEMLGSFRSRYESADGLLDIIPVGHRRVTGGEYEGDIYYFVNADENAEHRFLTYSELRPTFYETGRKSFQQTAPWGLGVPLKTMMKQRMILAGAKISGGKLSSSKETMVRSYTEASLDTPGIRRLMVTDFREIVTALDRRRPGTETERLFFIYPGRLKQYGFDKHTQRLVMTFEDERGCTADCIVKYRTETKSLIELLEKLCGKMSETRERRYSLLVSAYIEEGRLRFFPIEVYDFIRPEGLHDFELPPEYEQDSSCGYCAEEAGRHISRVWELLESIVQTGTQTEHDCTALINESRGLGMEGLAALTEDTVSAAESCRHTFEDNSRRVLRSMARLREYLGRAEEKTAVTAALNALTPKGE